MIEINNLTKIRVDEKNLKKIVQKVLKGEKIKRKVYLSIALLNPAKIKEFNRRYRKKNKVTDVLSFPESRKLRENFKIAPIQKIQSIGEIIICPAEVKKNAKRFNFSFKKELARALIHSVLHLLGYEHEKLKKEAKKMEKKQQYYLLKVLN